MKVSAALAIPTDDSNPEGNNEGTEEGRSLQLGPSPPERLAGAISPPSVG